MRSARAVRRAAARASAVGGLAFGSAVCKPYASIWRICEAMRTPESVIARATSAAAVAKSPIPITNSSVIGSSYLDVRDRAHDQRGRNQQPAGDEHERHAGCRFEQRPYVVRVDQGYYAGDRRRQ